MRFAEFIILLVVAALAVWMIARAVASLTKQKQLNKWRADFKTLPDGETIVYVAKGNETIEYASIAPVQNYEKQGRTALERAAEIEVSLDEAELWAERHAK